MWEEIEDLDDDLLEALNEARLRKRFVGGRLPLEWVGRVNLAPNTLAVALVVKMHIDMAGYEPVKVAGEMWEVLKLPGATRRRALTALEEAGIIKTERLPGQSVRIWLLDKP